MHRFWGKARRNSKWQKGSKHSRSRSSNQKNPRQHCFRSRCFLISSFFFQGKSTVTTRNVDPSPTSSPSLSLRLYLRALSASIAASRERRKTKNSRSYARSRFLKATIVLTKPRTFFSASGIGLEARATPLPPPREYSGEIDLPAFAGCKWTTPPNSRT